MSRPRYEIQAHGERSATLLIYGDIGDPWDEDAPDARGVVEDLAGLEVDTLHVRVNSYGGSVADGLGIMNAIARHPAHVIGYVDGVAASMGSAILMSADEVRAAESSLLMIHAPWGFAMGNARDMRKMADTLDRFGSVLADAYAPRAGKRQARDWIESGEDHWFTVEEAIEAGLVDDVDSDAEADASLAASMWHRYSSRAPMKIAAWVRDHRKPPKEANMSKPNKPKNDPPVTSDPDPTSSAPTAPAASSSTPAPDPAPNVVEIERAAEARTAERLQARNAEIAQAFGPFRAHAGVADLERRYLTEDITASADQARAELLRVLGAGASPAAGAAAFRTSDPDGDDAPGSDGDPGDFESLVADAIKAGASRRDAIRAVVAKHPQAHRAYLEGANPGREALIGAMAQTGA